MRIDISKGFSFLAFVTTVITDDDTYTWIKSANAAVEVEYVPATKPVSTFTFPTSALEWLEARDRSYARSRVQLE